MFIVTYYELATGFGARDVLVPTPVELNSSGKNMNKHMNQEKEQTPVRT